MKAKFINILLLLVLFTGCNGDDDSATTQSPKDPITNNDNLDNNDDSYTNNQDRDDSQFAVTDTYGELIVTEGKFKYSAKVKPWSSWWYPLRNKELFYKEDGDAPLQKYDKYMWKKYKEDAQSAIYEEDYIYNGLSAAWAGLCHSWAVVSVLYKEPNYAIRRAKTDFSVGDQKALLIKSYENVKGLKIYGDRFDGDSDDTYADVFPDQYHRMVQHWLGKKEMPFLMDYDPSYPVWTVPVYEVSFKITKESDNTMLVKSWMRYATPFVEDRNFVGTKNSIKIYTYRLHGEFISDTEFKVDTGEWTEASIADHPDYLIDFPEDAVPGTFNENLEVKKIHEILGIKNDSDEDETEELI